MGRLLLAATLAALTMFVISHAANATDADQKKSDREGLSGAGVAC
jgi:hypothetical protein